MREVLSPQIEDYLKNIYSLSQQGKVSTQALADALRVRPPSVTEMIKKLHDLGLVDHIPYKGVLLTEAGEKVALELIRHHRLLEMYLHQALGFPLEAVHAEADKLEHHISEEFEHRIAEWLGHPTHDPHGDPIPTSDGSLPSSGGFPLLDLEVGRTAQVGRIAANDEAFVRFLVEQGLVPGNKVELLERIPSASLMRLKVEDTVCHLSFEAAQKIWVEVQREVVS
jgi:DtxR family Mn-dependent transcriptional regulator